MNGRRIGFFDKNLNNFHSNHYLKLLRGPLAARGFTVSACHGLDDVPSRAWGRANDITYADTVAALLDACDALMILAPSNPEVHEAMAEAALPAGKRTYIDKTFAPDLAAARRIFALADRHGAPVVSTSALRYTGELGAFSPGELRRLCMWGGGSNFAEYSIHPVEAVIAAMGPEVAAARRSGDDGYGQIDLAFRDGRAATVFVTTATPCPVLAVATTAEKVAFLPIQSDFFLALLGRILDFYETGEVIVDRPETLAVRWILDVAAAGAGDWVAAPALV